MGGFLGFLRDVLILYVSFHLLIIWMFDTAVTVTLVVAVMLLAISAIWFMLQRIGIVPR